MNRRMALQTLFSAAAVTTLAGCRGFSAPAPFGRRGGDGKLLSLAVLNAMRNNAETSSLLIQVYSNDEGIVILKGLANSMSEFHAAERVATSVEGVTRVDNAINIR